LLNLMHSVFRFLLFSPLLTGLAATLLLASSASSQGLATGPMVPSLPAGSSVIVIVLPVQSHAPLGGWTGFPPAMGMDLSTPTACRCAASTGPVAWQPSTTYYQPRLPTLPAVGISEHRHPSFEPIPDYAPGLVPIPPGSVMRQRQLSISVATTGNSTPRVPALPFLRSLPSCPGGQCPSR